MCHSFLQMSKVRSVRCSFSPREIARMLANEHNKRIVIVDTSNEIGGDGYVPHSGIGACLKDASSKSQYAT